MTTTSATTRSTSSDGRAPLLAALGLGTSAVLTCIGTFWALNDAEGTEHGVGDWLLSVGVATVATALVFGLVVRTAAQGDPGRRALVTACFGVLSIVVFWAGLPAVLVAATVACALIDKDVMGRFGTQSKVALVLAAVTGASATALAFLG
jgi:hypothetical protein